MRVGIVGNIEKQEVSAIIPDFLGVLRDKGLDFAVERTLSDFLHLSVDDYPSCDSRELKERCDLIVSFGGDGTILSTARVLGSSGVPILGVKMGGMGFLAELMPDELHSRIDGILKGGYEVVERMVLRCELQEHGEDVELFALNDFVLNKGDASRVIRIKTYINDEFLNTYIADGLIVSTPTGSTAYSLAAGGPILLPTMEAIIINPISPHTLGARPVVIPGDRIVRIELEDTGEKTLLHGDGQVGKELEPGKSAVIRKADHNVKLVSCQSRTFFDVLRAKLNWGEDIRGL